MKTRFSPMAAKIAQTEGNKRYLIAWGRLSSGKTNEIRGILARDLRKNTVSFSLDGVSGAFA